MGSEMCIRDSCNYTRPHAGPKYAHVAHPLRALLKQGAEWPMNDEQKAAVQSLKDLILDAHVLAVPDEAAAILAANSWQTGSVPEGRPYEGGADTSGLATGGVFGQACPKTGKLLVLMYYSGPRSPSQQKWHPFAQEFYGLLCLRREAIKHFGRIPCILYTDHSNIVRMVSMPLKRLDAMHYRWMSELLQGGSKLVYRLGTGVMHKGVDGLSRNVPGIQELQLSKQRDWIEYRLQEKSGVPGAIEEDQVIRRTRCLSCPRSRLGITMRIDSITGRIRLTPAA